MALASGQGGWGAEGWSSPCDGRCDPCFHKDCGSTVEPFKVFCACGSALRRCDALVCLCGYAFIARADGGTEVGNGCVGLHRRSLSGDALCGLVREGAVPRSDDRLGCTVGELLSF